MQSEILVGINRYHCMYYAPSQPAGPIGNHRRWQRANRKRSIHQQLGTHGLWNCLLESMKRWRGRYINNWELMDYGIACWNQWNAGKAFTQHLSCMLCSNVLLRCLFRRYDSKLVDWVTPPDSYNYRTFRNFRPKPRCFLLCQTCSLVLQMPEILK